MKTKILTLLVLLAIAVVSCQKDEKEAVPQDVSFGIEQIDPSGLKGDFDCPVDLQGNLLVPVKAEVTIGGTTYFPEVFYLGGKLYTQAIKLAPGTYSVTKFVLRAANNAIVMATPNTGAAFAEYVTPSLPFDITVSAFKKIEIPIDVLCFMEAKYTQFGFFWFQVDEIVIWEKCFFGDLCVKDPLDYTGSNYALQPTGLQIDMPAIFKIHAYKGTVELPNSPFTNAFEPNWGVGAPVCVKWPDLIRVNGEVFNFELWIYVAVGNGFNYVKFHTWTFQDGALVSQGGTDGVIEFVLGNCNYSSTDLQLPPYMNLPNTVSVQVVHPGNPGYWNLNISNPFPAGTNYYLPIQNGVTGWCGDEFTTIGNNSTHTMHVYSSLYDATWPANMPWTKQDIAQVNWLFNNLGTFAGYTTLTPPLITTSDISQAQGTEIQNAIWALLQDKTVSGMSSTMATSASGHSNFTPLPGGWAAIIMVPGNNPQSAQLIFTVVDP